LAGLLKYVELLQGTARDDMAIQFMVQEVGGGVAMRWPDSDTEFLLDEDGELVFYVNDLGDNFTPNLAEGQYYLWARAAWDTSIESTKERFDIASLSSALESEILLMDEEGNEFTTKVCPTSTEVTLYFAFGIEGGELFDELVYAFQIGSLADGLLVDVSDTFIDETIYATEVTFATECTKYATLTVNGTITSVYWDINEATEVTEEVLVTGLIADGISFVLDMADPTALAIVDPIEALSDPASITVATLTFLITFEICVYKGIESWEATFSYGEAEIVLGADSIWENELTINASYEATKTTSDDAIITLVFDMKELDNIAVLATMTVHDCCNEDCILVDPCVECGVGGNLTHATEVFTFFMVDNVFFSSMLDIADIIELDGFFGEEGETPTIPATPGIGTITVKFADATWSPIQWENIGWSFYDPDGIFLFSSTPTIDATEEILGICSGYATKTEVTYVGTLTADGEPTETTITLYATAVDEVGNVFVFSYDFLYDTIAPTLTHFTAFRDQIINLSWIEFAFDQEPEAAELALTVTASGTFAYTRTDSRAGKYIPVVYRGHLTVQFSHHAEGNGGRFSRKYWGINQGSNRITLQSSITKYEM
jgi:hypothetical protein